LKKQTEAIRHVKREEYKARGGTVDTVREAERLVGSAMNIDISGLSEEQLNAALNGKNGVADAYDVLHRDGVLYEPF
jgi:hypothetical protein